MVKKEWFLCGGCVVEEFLWWWSFDVDGGLVVEDWCWWSTCGGGGLVVVED